MAQKENRLDLGAIMNEGKIFLAKLAQGAIGEENAYLLGTLIVAKLHQMAIGRQEVKEAERRNFYLYVDEFQNFITPSMASILSGARKYHLGLILAHQELRQLWNRDTDVASAVTSNPYTRICFRLGDFDAKKLEEGFSYFTARDLQNLGIGEAIARIERAEYDFNLRTLPLPDRDPKTAKLSRERIVTLSRQKYAKKREEVEAALAGPEPPAAREPTRQEAAQEGKKTSAAAEAMPRSRIPEGPTETRQPQRAAAPEPALPGRGGAQHKYLQQLVKRLAEGKGYRVVIEKQILGGTGSVDVSLEKDDRKIACEISITTSEGHELGNLQKCLAEGYAEVIILSSERKALDKIKKLASHELGADALKKVRFFLPEELISHLEAAEVKEARGNQTVPGNREILTAKELEGLLKIDVKTIYSYAQRGLLPYVRIQSNLRFLKSEILNWMAEHRFRPKSRTSRK